MSIEKRPKYTMPKFLKEYLKEKNSEFPEELGLYRELLGMDHYFHNCDDEEIHINLPRKNEAYKLFSNKLKELKSITQDKLNKMELEDVQELFNEVHADMKYYSKVDEIYGKAKFVVSSPHNYTEYHYDVGASGNLVIHDEDKELLKTLNKTIHNKLDELSIYLEDFRNFM